MSAYVKRRIKSLCDVALEPLRGERSAQISIRGLQGSNRNFGLIVLQESLPGTSPQQEPASAGARTTKQRKITVSEPKISPPSSHHGQEP